MAFEGHLMTCYAIIWLGGSKESCFMVICLVGVLSLLECLRDLFWVPCSLLCILMICPQLLITYCLLDLFADDAELHYSHSDLCVVETCLQSDLDSVADWLDSSRLCLNVEKSNCMLIGSRQRVANKGLGISVGGNMLTQVNSVRYLGVLIDPVLSWTLHINRMVSRVRSRLASIVCYGSLPPAVLCMLYSAFVMPLFDYCDVIWSPSTAKQTCLIEKVHSKFISKLPVTYHSKFPFTLTERRRFHTAIQIFKSLRQLSPPYLHDIFKFSFDITGHASRNINRLFVPRIFTNYGKKSFFYLLSRGHLMEQFIFVCYWSHNIVVI